ncbi:ArsR/SmtB family transcription factor [Roseospirillum parvum]|uniref:ArsR family transcriptional regulator n=1 Tax=Roseospirillum parvum TaxID=83401 RepID=A0A1G8DKA0_9PROT|nr:metalloregulator ArsR/SmtB family transcription factor [Roseospirillum parvum]SDH58011.1 ArsR family transcriptional regulator [Roseospirillum parvum]
MIAGDLVDQGRARQAADLMRLLGNEQRLLILCQLTEGEKSVGQLEALVGLRQSALSQHLARLRRKGLVATRRQSQNIFYRLASPETATLLSTLADLYCPAASNHETT